MTDKLVERLRQMDEAEKRLEHSSPTLVSLSTEALAQLKADAERYRWLRENGDKGIYVIPSHEKQRAGYPMIDLAQGAELDTIIDTNLKAIDAALREGQIGNATASG